MILGSDALAQTPASAPAGRAGRTQGVPASQTTSQGTQAPALIPESDAAETRNRLRQLLTKQYPETLLEVLRRDPSLLRYDAYLAPYPALAAFLAQHPEIALNPTYYLGAPRAEYTPAPPEIERIRNVRSMFESMTVMLGFVGFFALIGWVSKVIADQRRWNRASKIQQEAHTKVIERISSNEDLMTYIQTPAAQRYLMSAPPLAGPESPVSAPYSRILSSVQIGSVAALVGLGVLFVSWRWGRPDQSDWAGDFSRMLFLVGVVILACGAGFVMSGLASYALSRRFGLIQQPSNTSHA
ncbi:MAG TPA: hypothetical protein VJP86_12965 [Vicinamibacterales bacterium]|nr:hypothetical protein [Vicinamibacterales bacterium]